MMTQTPGQAGETKRQRAQRQETRTRSVAGREPSGVRSLGTPRSGGRPRHRRDTRADILKAARRIVDTRGPHAATTKEIARVAKCSEGSIYRYFESKYALFTELTGTSLPELRSFLQELPSRVGTADLAETMTELGRLALSFYQQIAPFASAGITDSGLRNTQRRQFRARGGPQAVVVEVGDYLRDEQDLGRLRADTSPIAVAGALLGSCFSRAFIVLWLGEDAKLGYNDEQFIQEMVKVLILGASPEIKAPRSRTREAVKTSEKNGKPGRVVNGQPSVR